MLGRHRNLNYCLVKALWEILEECGILKRNPCTKIWERFQCSRLGFSPSISRPPDMSFVLEFDEILISEIMKDEISYHQK